METRQRLHYDESLEQRLASAAKVLRERASNLQPGAERDAMLLRAHQAEATSRLSMSLRPK